MLLGLIAAPPDYRTTLNTYLEHHGAFLADDEPAALNEPPNGDLQWKKNPKKRNFDVRSSHLAAVDCPLTAW